MRQSHSLPGGKNPRRERDVETLLHRAVVGRRKIIRGLDRQAHHLDALPSGQVRVGLLVHADHHADGAKAIHA